MIISIHIKNFQSHKLTDIHFNSEMNIISGQSDSGKSSIIRALRWVCTNKPGGDAFKSHWGGMTEVSISTNDDHVITRRRDKSVNEYQMDDIVYKVPGTGIPEEIAKVLNMSELNWQFQHDAPYLLSDSSGEVARKLNKIANLDVIDTSLVNVNTKRLEVLRRCEDEIERKEELQKSLADYTWIKDCEKDLRIAERTERQINKLNEKRESLDILVKGILMQEGISDKILIPSTVTVKKIGNTLTNIDKKKKSVTDVIFIITDIQELEYIIKKNKCPDNTKEMDKKITKLIKMKQDIKDIDILLNDIEENEKAGIISTRIIIDLENKLPDKCPLCGR